MALTRILLLTIAAPALLIAQPAPTFEVASVKRALSDSPLTPFVRARAESPTAAR